jgi:hypothetical protein
MIDVSVTPAQQMYGGKREKKLLSGVSYSAAATDNYSF